MTTRPAKTGRSPSGRANEQRVPNVLRSLQDSAFEQGAYKLNQPVDTGKRWFNGDVIWRVVFDIGPLPNATTITHPTNLIFGTIVSLYAVAQQAGNVIPIPYEDGNTGNRVGLLLAGGNVRIRTGADFSSYTIAYAVIEYTK